MGKTWQKENDSGRMKEREAERHSGGRLFWFMLKACPRRYATGRLFLLALPIFGFF
ncbi:MAG: hypothetical protein VZQ47_04020 [Treponema sp.]|nr:hypothetical protein [Treponema sp.]MEE3434707.1 hypothetical protein [Treponema sp.]